jgi:hypothetical protein
MSYLLLIVEPAGARETRPVEERRGAYQRMLAYAQRLKDQGVLLASNSLRTGGVRLNMHAGRPSVVDGPFTESKEIVGGFYLLDCPTREQALRLAADCPAAEWATIEVRETGPCHE